MSPEERLQREREEQARWRPLQPEQITPVIERLLLGEYRETAEAREIERRSLLRLLSFAREQVPYYRDNERWQTARFDDRRSTAELLASLPILDKNEVQQSFESLKARRTPRGFEGHNIASSSGTTGRPTKVLFSAQAAGMFALFLQRQMRWERVNPAWTQAMIRLPRDLPKQRDGEPIARAMAHRQGHWLNFGGLFHTGPMIALDRGNSIEKQIEWLRRERPDYLVSFPGNIEALVYGAQGRPANSLQGLRSISSTLTKGMRSRVETATGLRVQENYGLNEIGIVAIRCPANRYHVMSEHCLVEIVDDEGRPCTPGETGRVLVTALSNLAMPLVRYDTRDLAEVVDGPCPCGRTLPTFGRVVGRYRPFGLAPAGTSDRLDLVSGTIETLPLALLEGLREYQLHQYRDGSFELRLVAKAGSSEALVEAVRKAWDDRFDESTPLRIHLLDKLPAPPGGKQQDFSSDFFPTVDEDGAGSGQH